MTASEDTHINVWSLRQGVELEHSIRMNDLMVMSVGSVKQAVLALCYDSSDVTMIKF